MTTPLTDPLTFDGALTFDVVAARPRLGSEAPGSPFVPQPWHRRTRARTPLSRGRPGPFPGCHHHQLFDKGLGRALAAAALADGKSTLINAASEPHVQDLCEFLNVLGARIENIGSNHLVIHGVEQLGEDGRLRQHV